MSVALITGSSGLIGSETVRFLHAKGFEVVGIDNNLRKYFFGEDGSVDWNTCILKKDLKGYTHCDNDIRDEAAIQRLFRRYGTEISLIVHAASQPSHDWAAREPMTDFSVNATGTLVLLEATRAFCPEAVFIFTSTNKVYGDAPNELPLVEQKTRWELENKYVFGHYGIDETMRVDQSKHSLFGASKLAADILVQEYGRYFGMTTGVFRGGCLTGPAHSGAELHGFLAYLISCVVKGCEYSVFGYKGKQVRDNIHSHDLVSAFWSFFENPRVGEVYNIGGSRHSNCSVLEAVALAEKMTGKPLSFKIVDTARSGDHQWWISDVRKFQSHYPKWSYRYSLSNIIEEIIGATEERLALKTKKKAKLKPSTPSSRELQ